jgi:deoxyribonuclease-4
MPLRIGIHTSTAGALENAALKAVELGANTFQIFSSSPRMWYAPAPDPASIRRMKDLRAKHDLTPLVIHDNYLINLASADDTIRRKSIAAFRGEIDRALAIGAEYLVMHPGAAKGLEPDDAINILAVSIAEACAGRKSSRIRILLENTAGQGSALGASFEELAEIRRRVQNGISFEAGYCIDTCHALAAGYNVAEAKGLRLAMQAMEKHLGIERVHVIHANDSRTPLGSRVDRHANIGEGHIGRDGFRRILHARQLRSKPFILETPIDNEGDDLRNMRTLKRLCSK